MENFRLEGRFLKLCYEFKVFIGSMKVAFYRTDYQKFLMCPLIKRLVPVIVSIHAAEPLKHSAELFRHSVELLKHSAGLLKHSADHLKHSAECLKSSTACLCYNAAHAVLISQGTRRV